MARAILVAAIVNAVSTPAHAGPRELEWTAFGTVSPFAAYDYIADGHGPSNKGIIELGLGGAVAVQSGRFELGAALQDDTGDGDPHRVHVIAAPVRIGLAMVRGAQYRVSLRGELGPAIGLAPGYGPSGGVLWTLGVTAALGIGVRIGISPSHAIALEAGIRLDVLPELNGPEPYLSDRQLINIQLPFVRVGYGWR